MLPSVVVGGSVVGKSGAVVAVIHDSESCSGQAMACTMLSSARALLFPVNIYPAYCTAGYLTGVYSMKILPIPHAVFAL